MSMDEIRIPLGDAEATRALGRDIATRLKPGDVVALSGDLGAGKTTLTQGLARGLGIESDVLSPTFALMSEYRNGRVPLLHVDAYRLTSASDADHLGLDEYLDNGWALVVEWPENIEGALPEGGPAVHLEHAGEERVARISTRPGSRWEEWLHARAGD